jgi:hypothetical protein
MRRMGKQIINMAVSAPISPNHAIINFHSPIERCGESGDKRMISDLQTDCRLETSVKINLKIGPMTSDKIESNILFGINLWFFMRNCKFYTA